MHVDETCLGQALEVEHGDRPRDPERSGDVVATQPAPFVGEQLVDLAAQRLVQRGDVVDRVIEGCVAGHASILRHKEVDVRKGVLYVQSSL